MDAEFVEFLDKKFQNLEQTLKEEIHGAEARLGERITRLENAVELLTRSVDRIVKLYENVVTEQRTIVADLARIKVVLREKLGVDI